MKINIENFFNRDFSKISIKFLKKITSAVGGILLVVLLFFIFEIYVPINDKSNETIIYTVKKGWGDDQIAEDLQKSGIIRNKNFFSFYVIFTLKHASLKAGDYILSPKMSIQQIAKKMADGDVIRDKVVILEGWDINDIGDYLAKKGACTKADFILLTKKDYSSQFSFLADKPKNLDIEGYLFPDTYEIGKSESCENIISYMLANFDKKLTSELREEIRAQKKSIFDVVVMASLIEKEVRNMDDKKVVSGILWKRLAIDMPLQLDATINYITGKSNPSSTIKDTKIDSPYNTYKYYGLPLGPISNPGLNSITAAIYPKKTNYWYYLSDGVTHFSETLEQHNAAKAKYLN